MQGWEMRVGYDEPRNEEHRAAQAPDRRRLHRRARHRHRAGLHALPAAGRRVTVETVIESISEEKATGAGVGYFITTRTVFTRPARRGGRLESFRVLKFIPSQPRPAATRERAAPRRRSPAASSRPWATTTAGGGRRSRRGRSRSSAARAAQKLRHPPRPMCGACGSMEWDHDRGERRGHAPHLHGDPLSAVPRLRVPDHRRAGRPRGGHADDVEPRRAATRAR